MVNNINNTTDKLVLLAADMASCQN